MRVTTPEERTPRVSTRTVELFVDPACPFAWMTSRWLLQAAQVREITPRFRVMSLAVLNEGRDLDPDYRRGIDDSWGAARLAVEIARTEGDEAFSRWYTAWGERFHVGDQKGDRRATATAALEDAGLPAALIDAYDRTEGDEVEQALRASHAEAIDKVGNDVGTPVISFGEGTEGTAYFGPVVSPAPKGEAAGRLLDGLEALAGVQGFYELKRSRTGGIDLS